MYSISALDGTQLYVTWMTRRPGYPKVDTIARHEAVSVGTRRPIFIEVCGERRHLGEQEKCMLRLRVPLT
jgi:hypothetical protein